LNPDSIINNKSVINQEMTDDILTNGDGESDMWFYFFR